MQIKRSTLLVVFFLLVLAGCSTATPQSGTPLPTPKADSAVVTGRIMNPAGQPYTDEYVFLAEVNYNDQHQGAYFLDTARSPGTKSDSNGYFHFDSIPPKDYVVVIGDPVGRSVALTDKSTGNPKIWKIEAGKTLEMGDLKFDYGN